MSVTSSMSKRTMRLRQRDRGHYLDKPFSNRFIHDAACDGLASNRTPRGILTWTGIVRYQAPTADVIAGVHVLPADPTEGESLQQGRTFTRRSLAIINATPTSGHVLLETGKVGFERFPTDITRVNITQNDRPLLHRDAPTRPAGAVRILPAFGAPVNEGSRIARVMQDADEQGIAQFPPL